MKLSIIIPVFNEEKTIQEVLDSVLAIKIPGVVKEVVVVNDGSADQTSKKIKEFISHHKSKNIFFLELEKNQGKGAAVIKGISFATGEYIVIQDADLEYNPADIITLVKALKGKNAAVYGTRLKRLPHLTKEERRLQFFMHYIGNKLLSLTTSLLYGQWITDMETCYKLFPKSALTGITLHAKGFEFEPEITAKLIKKGIKIFEVPITTKPRGYEEGKKLNTITDGIKAVKTLFMYRFTD